MNPHGYAPPDRAASLPDFPLVQLGRRTGFLATRACVAGEEGAQFHQPFFGDVRIVGAADLAQWTHGVGSALGLPSEAQGTGQHGSQGRDRARGWAWQVWLASCPFLEGDDAGLQEWVNPSCLVARWEDVEVFRADDSSELALAVVSREVRGSADFEAARMVLGFVRPRSKLRLRRGVSDAGILELSRLEEGARPVGMDAAELRSDPMVYENRDGLCLAGWPVTERIARLVAGRRAEDILPEVDRRQQAIDQERTQSS